MSGRMLRRSEDMGPTSHKGRACGILKGMLARYSGDDAGGMKEARDAGRDAKQMRMRRYRMLQKPHVSARVAVWCRCGARIDVVMDGEEGELEAIRHAELVK